jgi:hypothetical protein
VSDIDTVVVVVGLKALDPEWPIREVVVVGLKALDPEWPIREADMADAREFSHSLDPSPTLAAIPYRVKRVRAIPAE